MASQQRDTSPSGSSSSSGSSASGSASPPPPSATPSSSRPRKSQSSATHEYEPPEGYSLSDLSGSALQHDALANGDKQVWLFKLPEGVNAADLDGLKLNVGKKTRAASLRNKEDAYRLVEAKGSSPASQDARNAQAGHLEGKAKREGKKSQLVDQEEDDDGAAASSSTVAPGAYLYLPTGPRSVGQLRQSKMPIARRFELLLDVSAPAASTADEQETSSSKKTKTNGAKTPAEARMASIEKHRRLKGYFAPVGAMYDDAAVEAGLQAASATTTATSTPAKKDKKRKKGEVEAAEKEAVAAGVAPAASPSPRKDKKAKKEEAGDKASKKEAKAEKKEKKKEKKAAKA